MILHLDIAMRNTHEAQGVLYKDIHWGIICNREKWKLSKCIGEEFNKLLHSVYNKLL